MKYRKIKLSIVLLLGLGIIGLQAQDYTISFTGSVKSSAVDIVNVLNLTQGTRLTLNNSEALHLFGTTTNIETQFSGGNDLLIYPNPSGETSNIRFYNSKAGQVIIEISDITGKIIIRRSQHLVEGSHTFSVSGINSGIYLVNIYSSDWKLSGKLLINFENFGNTSIEYLGVDFTARPKSTLKSTQNFVQMQYNDGERILLKGISGNYSSVVTFVPTRDSTINFEFIECTDADSNHYATVTIGTQTWMAENLRTRKYLNGDPIQSNLNASQWCGDIIGACKIGNETYGNMYNAYAVEDSRKICPAGWHVPSASEWDKLLIYLGGEGLAGGPLKEAGTLHWLDPNVGATNQFGFNALPAGNYNPLTGSEFIQSVRSNADWWSCSKQDSMFWTVQCSYASTDAVRTEWKPICGLSVRCIKGDPDPSALVIHPSTTVIGQGDINSYGYAIAITEPVTDRTATGVTLNGTVYASGVPTTVTFEFAEKKVNYIPFEDILWQTVTADQSPLSGEIDVQVSARLEGLSRGTYMYRVKVEHPLSLWTQYGSIFEVDILGTGGQSPTVTTLAATDLSSHTATFNATINPHGLMTGVSFEWGTTTAYGSDCTVNWYSGDTVINVSLTWYYFEDGITYHYRARAGNMEEIVYGKDMELTIRVFTASTLAATNVEPASATLNGIVNANNLPTIVTFEYGTSTDYGQEVTAEQSPIEGITDTNVSAILTGLTGGIRYYYRVKAVNSSGTIYGANMTFNSAHLPVLTTFHASSITTTSAISGGNITDDGGAAITDRGIFYSTGPIPNQNAKWGAKRTHDGTGTGSFTSTLTGLLPNTTYNIRAYAVNSKGLAYGPTITFTTR